jgi:hypothetical protein
MGALTPPPGEVPRKKNSGNRYKYRRGLTGRAPGVRNRRTRETDELLARMGFDAPHVSLLKIGNDEANEKPLRVQALAYAAPFFASKPAPAPPLRFITESPQLGELTDAQSAARFAARVAEQVQAGKMDLDLARFLLGVAEMFVRLYDKVQLESEVEKHRELTRQAAK